MTTPNHIVRRSRARPVPSSDVGALTIESILSDYAARNTCLPGADSYSVEDRKNRKVIRQSREASKPVVVSFSEAYRRWDESGEVREAIFTALNAAYRMGYGVRCTPAPNDTTGNLHIVVKPENKIARNVIRAVLSDSEWCDRACRAAGVP